MSTHPRQGANHRPKYGYKQNLNWGTKRFLTVRVAYGSRNDSAASLKTHPASGKHGGQCKAAGSSAGLYFLQLLVSRLSEWPSALTTYLCLVKEQPRKSDQFQGLPKAILCCFLSPLSSSSVGYSVPLRWEHFAVTSLFTSCVSERRRLLLRWKDLTLEENAAQPLSSKLSLFL